MTIKGVGERHSGVYVVTHVTHTIDAGGYAQRFRVKRNALRPTGEEELRRTTARPGRSAVTQDTLERTVAELVRQVEHRYHGKYRGSSSTTPTRSSSAGCG